MSQSANSDSKEDQQLTSAKPGEVLQNPQPPRDKNQVIDIPKTNSGEKE
ncbi:MAG: hypothetical protein JWO91_483 [Acidobacteriaceae bacterium]|nr:hypothetical protein [Acidobacteriaceae bacterium]